MLAFVLPLFGVVCAAIVPARAQSVVTLIVTDPLTGMLNRANFEKEALREIRRNEQHDAFINAVTHELKTPFPMRGDLLNRQEEMLARWQAQGHPAVPLSVNVSVVQLQREEFVAEVENALRASGVSPSLLKLEITESVFMEDPDRAIAALDRLKQLGVRISLDDFGTGYSSLGHLRQREVRFGEAGHRCARLDGGAEAITHGVHQHRETVDAFAHIDVAQSQVHLYVWRKQGRHGMALSAAGVAPSAICTVTKPSSVAAATSCFHRRRTRGAMP